MDIFGRALKLMTRVQFTDINGNPLMVLSKDSHRNVLVSQLDV